MASDIAIEIEQILEEAWNKFLDYYNENAPKYRDLWECNVKELDEKGAQKSHWICWNEYDLMFYVGRFFHDILKEKGEEFKNIEIHFEKNVTPTNFEDYEFEDRLDKKKRPKVDMIVVREYKNDRFLLSAEAKYFHSASERYGEDPIEKIKADIKKLETILKSKIAQSVVFMLFDDYYWWADKTKAGEIEAFLDKIEKDEKIKVLRSTSKRKVEEISK